MTAEYIRTNVLAAKYQVSRCSLVRALKAGRCTGYKNNSLIYIRDDDRLQDVIKSYAMRGFPKPEGYLSTFEIARQYGLTTSAVNRCAKKHNAPRATRKKTLFFKLTDEFKEGLEKSAKMPKRCSSLLYAPVSARENQGVFSDADKPLSDLMAIFRGGNATSGRKS